MGTSSPKRVDAFPDVHVDASPSAAPPPFQTAGQPAPDADLRVFFTALRDEVLEASDRSKDRMRAEAEDARQAELERMLLEQNRLMGIVMNNLPVAVRHAAEEGARSATLLNYDGADKFGEFCYLYLIRGPPAHADREKLQAGGIVPLLHRLSGLVRPFTIRHVWNRATNANALVAYW
jgi:hypothetical protein